MTKPTTRLQEKKIFFILLILSVIVIQSCYHYRVINTKNDPGTEYRDTVMRSYLWGLVNKPQNFHVPNCTDTCAALDEVVLNTKRRGNNRGADTQRLRDLVSK